MKKSKQNESRKYSKLDIVILIALASEIVLFLLYNFLIKSYFLERYDSALFVERDMMKFFSVPFLIIVLIAVIYYFSEERKMTSKKYIVLSSIISIVILVALIVCNCNVWVVTKENISYNSLLKDEKIVYSYSDIETVLLCYSGDGLRHRGSTLTYKLIMNDGEEIEIELSNSYSKNSNSFIDFDKKVSMKRTTSGEFVEMANAEELNNYYKELF